MSLFVVLAAVLTFSILTLFGWVIRANALKKGGDAESGQLNAELDLLRVQRQELEHDVQVQSVGAGDKNRVLLELSENADALLQRKQQLSSSRPLVSPRSPVSSAASVMDHAWVYWLMGLSVVLLAIALYLKLGSPGAIERVRQPPSNDTAIDAASVQRLVARLEQRLGEEPDQAEGWMLLAQTKSKLGDFPGASAAYRRALALADKRADLRAVMPDLLSGLADVLAMQQEGSFSGEPEALIARALKINPEDRRSLALAATAAMRSGRNDEARGYWQRLKETLPPESPGSAQIDAVIAEISAGAVQARQPDQTIASERSVQRVGVGGSVDGLVNGSVDISAELKGRVRRGDTLFVFARRPAAAAAVAGSRMPLAVARFPLGDAASGAGEWPRSFELTDAMAMAPGAKLSDAAEVEIVARISHTGSAIAASGDLTSEPRTVNPGKHTRNLKLVVDRIVP